MTFLLSLFSTNPYVELPQSLSGWTGWLCLLAIIVLLLRRWKGYNRSQWGNMERLQAGTLALATVVTNILIGVRLPAGAALPPPGMPVDPRGPALMIFSALPWLLAGGMLGPLPAAILALLAGLLRALWDSHSIFAPLEMALLAVLFAAAVNQRYRTPTFRLLRRPLAAAGLIALIYPVLYLLVTPLVASGAPASRLDYALTHVAMESLAFAIEALLAGVFCEVVASTMPELWGRQGTLLPSPAERSLRARFLFGMAPVAAVLVVALMAGDWFVAGNAASNLLRDRMANAAEMATANIPTFLEAGQNLILQLADDPKLLDVTGEEAAALLEEDLRTVPYFRQLFLIDGNGDQIASYPPGAYSSVKSPVEEQVGVQMALSGVPVQSYSIPPEKGEKAAQVSFVAGLRNQDREISRVLIGRSDLATNPFTQPILESLNAMAGVDGQGILIDENGQVLYHPDSNQLMTKFSGRVSSVPDFYDEAAPDGTRRLVYYQPAEGRPWAVALMVPAHRAQELALRIALPLLGMIALMAVVAVIFLSLDIRMVTGSLQTLAGEAAAIAQGNLENPLPVDGEDEVGHLRRAFEKMRRSLKDRMEEQNLLLEASQGVASSLEMSEAVRPVLASALASGAVAARVVLSPATMPELDSTGAQAPVAYGLGPALNLYSDLDEQILAISRQQDRLVMTNMTRPRLLNFANGEPRPESLLAVALRHENQYYGTLWVAFDQPHRFTEEEVRFIATLAGQAALAAANARLFLSAEIGRQRLAAILASSPDPILVTDQSDCLLLANPAAWQALGLGMETDEGQPIERVITQTELVDLLHSGAGEKQSLEIALPGGQVFLATATSVLAEGQRVGRVCVLRDVTRFKELDTLKSEFVSTVSHDLRSPLTLMRGYATMLEMVGQLNEQQVGYVRKIIGGVESMSRLVNNLLDLGRIEAGVGLQLEMVPVHDVVERVVGALQLQAAQKHIQLSAEIPQQTIPLIEADQALLQQALQNLVENGVKYTRSEGKVTVRVQARDDRMVFEVADTGIGISPMDQTRLFERFYRGSQQSAKDQRGTGLGLAIVKSIAERHGGQVWVESQLGKGSTFTFSIPLRQTRQPVNIANPA